MVEITGVPHLLLAPQHIKRPGQQRAGGIKSAPRKG